MIILADRSGRPLSRKISSVGEGIRLPMLFLSIPWLSASTSLIFGHKKQQGTDAMLFSYFTVHFILQMSWTDLIWQGHLCILSDAAEATGIKQAEAFIPVLIQVGMMKRYMQRKRIRCISRTPY
ncbi:MAG: hypothetical protein K6A68_14155, partial [Clostridiales bacterium]|nr:hypothetical protein [Clostridiales bacterium]